MFIPYELTNTIGITLFGITIPIFIFAVTLLGNATEKAKEEENKLKEEKQKELDIKISETESNLTEAKKTGDTSSLESELNNLKNNRKETAGQIKKINKKFSYLRFRESVVYPGSFFILAVLVNHIAKILKEVDTGIFLWIISIIFICIGIRRLFKSLLLVQKISIITDEYQTKKLTKALKEALSLHENEKKINLALSFDKPKQFPRTYKQNENIEIIFNIRLIKGDMAKNVRVLFFIPDGFGLIKPGEDRSCRQNETFSLPNIRTVAIELNDINIRTCSQRILKIKTPDIVGEYYLSYQIGADGYGSEMDSVKIIIT